MNKVELLATIAANPALQGETPMHVTFPATVAHKTKNGEIRREDYPITAWNGTAQWALDNLAVGQQAVIYGYLTQKKDHSIEICAKQILLLLQNGQKPVSVHDNTDGVISGEPNRSKGASSACAVDTPESKPNETPSVPAASNVCPACSDPCTADSDASLCVPAEQELNELSAPPEPVAPVLAEGNNDARKSDET